MQERITMNGIEIRQPDTGLSYSYATRYSDDSVETQDGVSHGTTISTHESLGYLATGLSAAEASQILQIVARGNTFTLHYFSLHRAQWTSNVFRVPSASLSIGSLIENSELLDSLSFTMEGVNPI